MRRVKPKTRKIMKRVARAVQKKDLKLSKREAALEIKTNRLLEKGRERGYVTYEDILKEFPTVEEDILFLDKLYEKFSTASIDVLEGGGMLDAGAADDLLDKKNVYKRQEAPMTQFKCISRR